jgi:DNA gyrase/topoisomerase IV subunit B
MDPKTRALVRVNSKDFESSNRIIEILMGQDPSIRRE